LYLYNVNEQNNASKKSLRKQRFGLKKREKGKLLKMGMKDVDSGDKGRK